MRWIKALGEVKIERLQITREDAQRGGRIPADWSKVVVSPNFRTGDEEVCINYSRISPLWAELEHSGHNIYLNMKRPITCTYKQKKKNAKGKEIK